MVKLRDIRPKPMYKTFVARYDSLAIVGFFTEIPSPNKGIVVAPFRQSTMLKNTIRKFDVFFKDCFVARNEAISRELMLTVSADDTI